METYDIVMLVVLGGATLFGFLKGFAWQVASLASLVLSYMMALKFSDQVAPLLNADPRWNKYLAMLVIYAGTSLAVWMGFRFVSGAINRIRLNEFDRQIGGLFGLIKGALLCTIITFFAVTLSETTRGAVLKSKSGGYIARFLHEAKPIMPPELSELLGPYVDKLNRGLDPTQTVEHPQLPDPNALQNGYQQLQNGLQTLSNFGGQPPYAPPQFQYPPYQPGANQPATYPPAYDYQSGQNYQPQNR
jgi:membrane protein required for colicin V production